MTTMEKMVVLSPRKRQREENTTTAKILPYFTRIEETETNENSEINRSPSKKTHICTLCERKCNGTKAWNLASHLSRCHQKFYADITDTKKEPLAVTRLKVLQNCTEAVSVNGRPFELLHDSSYRKQIQRTLDELMAAKLGLNLSDHNLTVVKEHLSKTANNVRQKIQTEVKNRPLSLLVDIVTKHKRSILGISVQYALNGDLKVRSIGFIELSERHTGKYLAEVIIKRLKGLGIQLIQIFTITTDNGKNVLKLVRDMSNYLQTEVDKCKEKQKESQNVMSQGLPNTSICNASEIDDAICELLASCSEIEEEEEVALVNARDEVPSACHETLLEAMTNEMKNYGADIIWNITGINCTAHILQLAVHDSLKRLPTIHENVISLCREMGIFLRLQSTITDMAQKNIEYLLPRLEVKTRWSSTYSMVYIIIFGIRMLIYFLIVSFKFTNFQLLSCFIFIVAA